MGKETPQVCSLEALTGKKFGSPDYLFFLSCTRER